MFKIVVLTDLERLPFSAKQFASESLQKLSFDKDIQIFMVPGQATAIDASLFDECNAVIVRPTDYFEIKPAMFSTAAKPLYIFSVSVGTDHLSEFKGNDAVFRIKATQEPDTNARGVAAFNFLLAKALFARLPANLDNIGRGRFKAVPDQTNLVGKNWLVLGSGSQVQHLLNFGFFTGIEKFFVWNPEMDEERFKKCVCHLERTAGSALEIDGENLVAKVVCSVNGGASATTMEIVGTTDWKDHASEADIVSVHVPLCKEVRGTKPKNIRFIDKSFIAELTKKPILINTARGQLIEERDILEALLEGRLSGVAVDVLGREAERRSAHLDSELWMSKLPKLTLATPKIATDNKSKKVQNLIITPHISGSADNDVLPMWQFILKQLNHVIEAGGTA